MRQLAPRRFFRNDELVHIAYGEPFSVYFHSNWRRGGWDMQPEDREWSAAVHLRDGSELIRSATV
jgi:hypothetical protein